jgi:hypothetical protein
MRGALRLLKPLMRIALSTSSTGAFITWFHDRNFLRSRLYPASEFLSLVFCERMVSTRTSTPLPQHWIGRGP